VITTTLVVGATPAVREAAIAASLIPDTQTAIILEGLPDANSPLNAASTRLRIARIAPGCICCTGNLTMRVTLDRMIRSKPEKLYIGLTTSSHLAQVRAFLSTPPYDKLLALTKDLHA
jgi:G3E family GTPase